MRSEMTCPIENELLPPIDRLLADRRAPAYEPSVRWAPAPADLAPSSLSGALAVQGAAAGVVDALVDALPVGIVMTNRLGHVIYANDAARSSRVVELPALRRAIVHAVSADRARREERLECRAPGGGRHGGARRWFDVAITPVPGDDRGPVGALLTITDETTRIQATEWRPLIDSLARL